MKKNIFRYLAYSFVTAAALTLGSCSSEDKYDVEGNPDKMRHCYEMGRRKALSMIDEIKNFCSTTSKGDDYSDR